MSSSRFSRSFNSRCLNKNKLELVKIKLNDHFSKLILTHLSDINTLWSVIKNEISYCVNSVAPFKTLNVKKALHAPWYDSHLIKLSFKCDRMYSKYLEDKSSENRLEFMKFRNKYRSATRHKKSSYYKNFIKNFSISSSKLWKKLKPFFQPNKITTLSPHFFALVNKNFNCHDMVNLFSNYFSSILNKFDLINIDSCLDYVENHFRNINFQQKICKTDKFLIEPLSLASVIDQLKKIDPKVRLV